MKMKKILLAVLVLAMVFSFASCSKVLTYDEYVAAELGSNVTIEAYVQDTQDWWDNKITVYAADEDGAYFIYELACSEEDAVKLVPGTKIKVSGKKADYAGEIEIAEATFEFAGDDTYVAAAKDLTDKLGADDLVNYQNQLATFKGVEVVSFEYQNGARGKDVYLTVKKGDANYSFCVESYLTGPDSDVYKAVEALEAGDIVDVTGFVYWYNGINTHITAVVKK